MVLRGELGMSVVQLFSGDGVCLQDMNRFFCGGQYADLEGHEVAMLQSMIDTRLLCYT